MGMLIHLTMDADNYTVEYIRVDENTVMCNLVYHGADDEAKTVKPELVAVFDYSSSMMQNGIYECVRAMDRLIRAHGSPVHLVLYNHLASSCVVQEAPRIYADGATSFPAAFRELQQVVEQLPPDHNIEIVFFTDGENTRDNSILPYAIERLQTCLKSRSTRVHSIGIEGQSDSNMMQILSRMGSADGSYGFFTHMIENSASLEVDRLIEMIQPCVTMEFLGQNVRFDRDNKATVFIRDAEMDCPQAGLMDRLDHLRHLVDTTARSEFRLNQVHKLQQMTKAIFDEAGCQPRVTRKALRTALQPINEVINNMFQMCERGVKTNEGLAKLMVQARNARSNRFGKMTAARADRNAEAIAREDRAIEQLALQYTDAPPEIEITNSDGSPFEGICMLTTFSPLDLICDGDALGIGVRCNVREACIADPTLLQVEYVSSAYFGCDAFIDAAGWSVDQGNTVGYGAATQVVVDNARQNVNGVLPLYLCDEHWDMACNYVRRMCGHLCCKDPLQGTARHALYSYLLVLRKLRDQDGTVYQLLAHLVKRTLLKLHERWSTVIPTPEQFASKICHRMPDVVTNLDLLKIMWEELGMDSTVADLYLQEERVRRGKPTIERADLLQIGQIDDDTWILPYVHENTPKSKDASTDYTSFSRVLCDKIRDDVMVPKINAALIGEDDSDDGDMQVIVPSLDEYSLEINAPNHWGQLDQDPVRNVAIYLQAAEQKKSTDRAAHYRDFFSMPYDTVELYVRKFIVDAIRTERDNRVTSILSALNSRGTSERLARVADMSLVQFAATMYADCWWGRNITKYLMACKNEDQLRLVLDGACVAGAFFNNKEEYDHMEEEAERRDGLYNIVNAVERGVIRLWNDSKLRMKQRWHPSARNANTFARIARSWLTYDMAVRYFGQHRADCFETIWKMD